MSTHQFDVFNNLKGNIPPDPQRAATKVLLLFKAAPFLAKVRKQKLMFDSIII